MRAVVLGEAMFEYRARANPGALTYGGDTLNTAIHLARLGVHVQYVSALGTDGLSDRLCGAWQSEGVDTHHVLRHPDRQPGIYAIQNDPDGERSFLYWRDQSAARDMFALPGMAAALESAADADLLCYSLITLAILPEDAREQLLDLARQRRRRGLPVAFDGNYRAVLWPSREEALHWSKRGAAAADFGLPTLSDEQALRDDPCDAIRMSEHWLDTGCGEVALKTGAEGCVLAVPGSAVAVTPLETLTVVDSSGAGDAFNAGYLMARLRGQDRVAAARAGQAVAGWVIQRPGAIPLLDAGAPYAELSAGSFHPPAD